MSQVRGRLVSEVRLLCGEPSDLSLSQGGLPTNLIFEEICNIEAEMLRDLELSAKNARVAKIEPSLVQDESEFAITTSDFLTASYVYLQTDPSSDIWWPVEIVNHSALFDMGVAGTPAIAFSGTPKRAYLSWTPDGTQTLRIWYERTGNDDPEMAGQTELGGLYDEYLKLQAAAQCREHLKMEVGAVLASRLTKSERQWQKHVNRSLQQGAGHKRPVYTPPRFRRYLRGVDRTTFFPREN